MRNNTESSLSDLTAIGRRSRFGNVNEWKSPHTEVRSLALASRGLSETNIYYKITK